MIINSSLLSLLNGLTTISLTIEIVKTKRLTSQSPIAVEILEAGGWLTINNCQFVVIRDTIKLTFEKNFINEALSIRLNALDQGISRYKIVRIKGSIKNSQNFEITNTDGWVNFVCPFPVFGPYAFINSWLTITSRQIFTSYTKNVELHVNWQIKPGNDVMATITTGSASYTIQLNTLTNLLIQLPIYKDNLKITLSKIDDPPFDYAQRYVEAELKGHQAPAPPINPTIQSLYIDYELIAEASDLIIT